MSSKADRGEGNTERSDKGRDGSTSDRRVSDITEMKEAQKTNAIYRCLGQGGGSASSKQTRYLGEEAEEGEPSIPKPESLQQRLAGLPALRHVGS